MTTDYVEAACARLNIVRRQLLVCRAEGDEVVIVVDRGVAGCPKIRLPVSELSAQVAVEHEMAMPETYIPSKQPALKARGRPKKQ